MKNTLKSRMISFFLLNFGYLIPITLKTLKMKKGLKTIGIFILALQLQACGEMEIPDPNPGGNTGIDFSININSNPYTPLKTLGEAVIVTSQKVIVINVASGSFAALQSYCPNDQATNLNFNKSNATLVCPKDNASFDLNGKGSSGNLKKFRTTFSNNTGEIRIFE
jgi:nitrite reductase/ring-hydroxylating ferredoxin subunit